MKTTSALIAVLVLTSGCRTMWIDSGQPPMHAASNPQATTPLGSFYSLPKGLVTVRVLADKDPKTLPVAGRLALLNADTPRLVPDPNHYYPIGGAFSAFANDEVTVETTKEGLLTSISTKSTDQSLAVIQKLVQLATEAAKAQAGLSPLRGITSYDAAKALVVMVAETEMDPTDCAAVARFGDLLAARLATTARVTVTRPGFNDGLAPAGTPMVACRYQTGTPLVAARRTVERCARGICFRPLIPYTIDVCLAPGEGNTCAATAFDSVTVLLPNDAPLLAVDIVRRPFVENTANYTFDNATGIPTKAEVKKPSEVVGFLSIPVEVAKAIVSIPSAILDFKVTRIADQKEVLEAQKALLDAQKALVEAMKQ